MARQEINGRPIIWRPQPRQAAFMRRSEDEALYGGAAGGGKSDALVIEALRQVDVPNYRALILRKTFPQLRELIDKTMASLAGLNGISLPSFGSSMDPEDARALRNYLYQLQEQLGYVLTNLDSENMSENFLSSKGETE